jgi:hypothetical protein
LTFLVSVRVPRVPVPAGASERFTSARIEPWSIRASETPRATISARSCATYAFAISGAFSRAPMIGLVTISMRGMPARL